MKRTIEEPCALVAQARFCEGLEDFIVGKLLSVERSSCVQRGVNKIGARGLTVQRGNRSTRPEAEFGRVMGEHLPFYGCLIDSFLAQKA